MEKREENRCSVRLSRLDCRGAFCIMGFYSFFNDGLKVDWRDRAEVAHRFVLFFVGCSDYCWMVDSHGSYIIWEVCCC